MEAIYNSTLVEIKLNNTTGKYYLPDSDILRGKAIVGISALASFEDQTIEPELGVTTNPNFYNGQVYAPSGNQVVNRSFLNSCFLTLEANSKRFVDQFNFQHFCENPHRQALLKVAAIQGFNPTRSFIEFTGPAADIVTGTSILLTVSYK